MTGTSRKERERELRRTEIIEAAERIIFEKGYYAATMDDVAKEAQFSKRTVYMYFNSKEQIYFEIMTRGYRRLLHLLEQDEGSTLSAPEEILQLGWTYYRFGQEYPDYYQAIMEYENGEMDFAKGVPDASREACYELGEQVMNRLVTMLERGKAEGTLHYDEAPRQVGLVLWASMTGVLNIAKRKRLYLDHYFHTTQEELIREAFLLLLRSITR